ncbi:uncharacterized protein PGTG_22344 [Puccinia graminis f. sp. tritici CRL 75-36-700-3]|uniref:Uncharacterized protein n=1 Tax=Puccinia graminis f. sp. tritici (strain CRL 75-36-700-3 / race SCCL) TaxID=418459 RepID=H6QUJ6_PUCGT|nr:uncharacterized protein PGTG_22344 [Puccinia graminis f. sp. tritici CRL 75-36-700-3]EHS64708.1 hypothetical protein PGTG_22344 [Puccinia graminis f. sp. tritici CRL 75-36-700-3]
MSFGEEDPFRQACLSCVLAEGVSSPRYGVHTGLACRAWHIFNGQAQAVPSMRLQARIDRLAITIALATTELKLESSGWEARWSHCRCASKTRGATRWRRLPEVFC